MHSLIHLTILSIIFILLIFFMRNFNYIVKQIRKISEEPSGYFKFGQIIILFFAIFVFLSILIYNMFIDPKEVSSISVFLTVVVGILGTIIGLFFGAKAEHYITSPRRDFIKNYRDHSKQLVYKTKNLIQELINRLKEK